MLVREHEERHASEQLLAKQLLQVLLDLCHAHLVSRIDHVDESIGLVVVVAPVGADLSLATDIPNIELEAILLLHA